MATFTPPTSEDIPRVIEAEMNPAEYRFWSHYRNFAAGKTVILKVDNTTVETVWPIDVPVEGTWTQESFRGVAVAQIQRIFMGGHRHEVNSAEVTALTNAGYGAFIS